MINKIKINKSIFISDNSKCFIIAEAGVNHDGDFNKAKQLIDIAARAKANAVKFQLFKSQKLTSKEAFLATYHKKGLKNKKETLAELLKRLELSKKNYARLCKYAREKKILIFATPFDVSNAKFLESLNTPLYKIASFSLTNFRLVEYIAKLNKPTLVSVGLHNLREIEHMVNIFKKYNNKKLILLQCTSHYPSSPCDSNLRFMKTLRYAFETNVGYSDHTMGINVSLAAVALGAKVLEKHFTLKTSDYGVDHDASISPEELVKLVDGIREVESSLGSTAKIIPEIEQEIIKVHRPSLVSKTIIKKGKIIKKSMIDIKKPGTGINPLDINWVIGRRTKVSIPANIIIRREHLI
jgi:N,N'-diacetyllegionaminate synthase